MPIVRVLLACAAVAGFTGCVSPLDRPADTQGEFLPHTQLEFSAAAQDALSEEDRALIRQIAAHAHREVRALLPDLPASVTLQVNVGAGVIPETGEVGSSIAPGRIGWVLDPDHPAGATAIIRTHLRTTLFHELHHQARGWTFQDNPPPSSIMDAVIAEGMASVFARDFAGAQVPWADHPPDGPAWLADLQQNGSLSRYAQWMFEHPDGRRWIGYRTGAYVVDQAMAASGETSATLARVPTREVLAMAGANTTD